MAALMTRRFSQITEITKLMEECKSMGIQTLGPDVNESYEDFGVNSKGAIRFGLKAIKGMGEMAAKSIVEERRKNGTFKDIYDFVQRISFANVNRKALESLALSGGFDCFGLRREQYFGKDGKGVQFLDTLLRFGQNYQREKMEAKLTFFGDDFPVDIAFPPAPEAEEWSTIERLNKERDLVGIYLSAHPLDDYKIILQKMCNTHCSELDDKMALTKKAEIKLGGIVTKVRSAVTKSGKPCGFVTVEDYEGSGEIALFGEEWGRWRGMFAVGSSVYVSARCVQKYPNSSFVDFSIGDIQYLQTVKEQRVERFTIVMNAENLDQVVANDITTIAKECANGRTQLYIQLLDANHDSVLLQSRAREISVSAKLVEYVEDHSFMSYLVN